MIDPEEKSINEADENIIIDLLNQPDRNNTILINDMSKSQTDDYHKLRP